MSRPEQIPVGVLLVPCSAALLLASLVACARIVPRESPRPEAGIRLTSTVVSPTPTRTANPDFVLDDYTPSPAEPPISSTQDATMFNHLGDLALDRIERVAWLPNSSELAVTGEQNGRAGLFLFDARTLELRWFRKAGILGLSVSPNGALVVTSGQGMQWWDLASGEELGSVEGNAYVYNALMPDDTTVISGFWQMGTAEDAFEPFLSYVLSIDIRTRAVLRPEMWIEATGLLEALVPSPSGNVVALVLAATVPQAEDHVTIIDVMAWEPVCDVPGHVVAFSPDGSRIAVGGMGGAVLVLASLNCEQLIVVARDPRPTELAAREPLDIDFSHDGNRLFVASGLTGTIEEWQLGTGELLARSETASLAPLAFDPVVFSPDGALAALILSELQGPPRRVQLLQVVSP